jgi:hypothetical protein
VYLPFQSIGDESSCTAPLQIEEETTLGLLRTHESAMEQKIKEVNAQLKTPKNKKNPRPLSELSQLSEERDRCE